MHGRVASAAPVANETRSGQLAGEFAVLHNAPFFCGKMCRSG